MQRWTLIVGLVTLAAPSPGCGGDRPETRAPDAPTRVTSEVEDDAGSAAPVDLGSETGKSPGPDLHPAPPVD